MMWKPPTIMKTPKIAGRNDSRSTGCDAVLGGNQPRRQSDDDQRQPIQRSMRRHWTERLPAHPHEPQANSGTIQPCEYKPSLQAALVSANMSQ